MGEFVRLETDGAIGTIRLDRPKMNAINTQLRVELEEAAREATARDDLRAIVIYGGERVFAAGADIKEMEALSYADMLSWGIGLQDALKVVARIPKPVIAAVNGFAIGGGHVLHVVCDLTIASSTARFGQTGPRVGSFDAGFGSAYLARIVGEKRAREIWYLCHQYTAEQMQAWGLVNAVVEPERLMDEARTWASEILTKSPTAIRVLKHSFNAEHEGIAGISQLSFDALELFVRTDEAAEGVRAFNEKRDPDFRPYR